MRTCSDNHASGSPSTHRHQRSPSVSSWATISLLEPRRFSSVSEFLTHAVCQLLGTVKNHRVSCLFINGSRLPAVRLAESLPGGSEPTSPKPFNRTDRRLTARACDTTRAVREGTERIPAPAAGVNKPQTQKHAETTPYSSENVLADSWLQRRLRLPRGRDATARCPHVFEMINVILLVQKRALFLKGLQIELSRVLQKPPSLVLVDDHPSHV